ncbi:hypothetical protein CTI14_45705, partial [Methylobacterium radiotolerans]
THTAYQIVPYEGYISLAERINRVAPIDGLKKTAFFTTGVEAVENAVKIARSATGRSGVIGLLRFVPRPHVLGMALTGKVAPYKLSFGPMPGDIYHVPFPHAHGLSDRAVRRLHLARRAHQPRGPHRWPEEDR